MRGVGEAEVGERTGRQKLAEFVVNLRRGYGMMGEQRQPQRHGQYGEKSEAPPRMAHERHRTAISP